VTATIVSWVLAVAAGLLAIPTAILCVEIVASLVWRTQAAPSGSAVAGRIAVLVPAHNESTGITPTLEDIGRQLRPGDRLLVVADNCNDDTADVARLSGALVVERQDASRFGKGYALDRGLRCLESDPPDIVVMVDADCRLAKDAIPSLAGACSTAGRPVQALYLMNAPAGALVAHEVAAFAWRLKNWVRPLGLQNLGGPCQLTGTGMAFPWTAIRAIDLANGWIVEDLKLGLELAAAGHAPLFYPAALVTSEFAASGQAADDQRFRWEHGHIMTIFRLAPRFLFTAIAHRDARLLALTLDLLVPPLSLLTLLLTLLLAVTAAATLTGAGPAGFVIIGSCLLALVISVGFAWGKYGRDILPPREILSVPPYVLGKLGLYGQILLGRMTAQWIKTGRSKF
jgi:cellulose synthase/poly-beta-1,6-N-acetylglucosamine synthase-like glycosyltransferase